jgi:hypothetical protein
MEELNVIDVTPENVQKETLFCIKSINNPGFICKEKWFGERHTEGLHLKIIKNEAGKMSGFIEYIPAEQAWRPVKGDNFMFIHCMFTYPNSERNRGHAMRLVGECEKEAFATGKHGVCVMTSKGPWITDKRIFIRMGYFEVEKLGRFELMVKKFNPSVPNPKLIDWKSKQKGYKGWHLLYADQCPWHEKSVQAIKRVAEESGIDLKIKKITKSEEARNGPSGFGVFALLKDGRLLEDHYISETRFRNILNKERGQIRNDG